MGLRSRRGSSATIRTTRTFSGTSEPLPEEDREESSAGPSRLPRLDSHTTEAQDDAMGGPSDGGRETRGTTKRLNPKSSSSWLRWNSPALTFPRSVSRDKGKGKEKQEELGGSTTVESPVSSLPPGESQEHASSPSQPMEADKMKGPSKSDTSGVSSESGGQPGSSAPGGVPPPRGRWWTRPTASTSNAEPPTPQGQPEPSAVSPPVDAIQPKPPVEPERQPVDRSTAQDTAQVAKDPAPNSSAPDAREFGALTASPTSEAVEPKVEGSRWRGYLWGSGKLAPSSNPPIEAPAGQQDSDNQNNAPVVPQDTSPDHSLVQAETPPHSSATTDPQQSSKPGWGSYLYSFVATPTNNNVNEATAVIPENGPSEDQKPATAPPVVAIQAASPLSTKDAPPSASQPASISTSPTPAPSTSMRKGSTSSQSGWLNYLAFRASQKKIANTSTASIKSGKERKSLEIGEEVMDFSSDPNFPQPKSSKSVATPAETAKDDIIRERTKSKEEPLSKKASQNLAVKARRLSNASLQSGGSKTPLSSSPKAKSISKMSTTSSLPPPPAPALVQPNFVIPSFDTTFNRPPRSLPPLTENSGATGLAWRAIGAVGSYVYSPDNKASGAEARGMREGRKVGAGLPRRIGLMGEKEDDGWKHVKRVAVVGVHGWFPAKMLNS